MPTPEGAAHVDAVLRAFADFLRHSAPIVGPLSRRADDPGYWNDWVQANWEAMVEAALPRGLTVRLRVYADGAACNGRRSRITAPHLEETHLVVCRPRGDLRMSDLVTGEVVSSAATGIVFDRFVAIDRDRCIEAPPFDCVWAWTTEDRRVVLPLDGVVFDLRRTSRSEGIRSNVIRPGIDLPGDHRSM